ncbi:MAG: HIT domain-containing protein [Clostridiaceae bacterium]|nr:HIT domain-containing protein [Clostridiaceae bacterium]
MKDCLFCRLAAGVGESLIWENADLAVFADIKPAAKVHWLIVPKAHYDNILDLCSTEEGCGVFRRLGEVLPTIVDLAGLTESGFRLITNCGRDGRQTVEHLHFHLLGGERLGVHV